MTSLSAEMTSSQYSYYEQPPPEEGAERESEGGRGIALYIYSWVMHSTSVEIKGGVLVSWVASVITMVARGAALKKMILSEEVAD